MIIQNRDGSLVGETGHRWRSEKQQPNYYAAVPAYLLDEPSNLIDRIIGFAFDTIGALHLEVRVYDAVEHNGLTQNEACC